MKPNAKTMAFYAEIDKGHIPKVTFDVLASNMSRIDMQLSKKGIFICVADKEKINESRIIWDIQWDKKNFNLPYICSKNMWVSLSVKSLNKMLKSVKKKNTIAFYVKKSELNTLYIIIFSSNSQEGKQQQSCETINIPIKQLSDEDIEKATGIILPSEYINNSNKKLKAYSDPMVICSTGFQKVKKMMSLCKTDLSITMQKNNYIAFKVGDSNVVGNLLEFGKLTLTPDDEDENENENEGENEDENENENEEENEGDNEDENEDEDENENEKYPSLYCSEFSPALFSSIVKLPGLCKKIEFYAPNIEHFPLKVVAITSSELGKITCYVKSQEQIKTIESQQLG